MADSHSAVRFNFEQGRNILRFAEHLIELWARERLMPIRLGYPEVEVLVKELAARLADEIGLPALRSAHYVGIPRGGSIVLGMLAYVLDLERRALAPPPRDGMLVIVDDCSASGTRFAEFLPNFGHREVVFAHLCSPPALREAIPAQEPRVRACVGAMDLEDMAPTLYPDPAEYETWLTARRQDTTPKRYLHAVVQPAAFPWNEPDLNLQRPEDGKILDSWRLHPPDACLKNWARLGLPPVAGVRPVIRCHPDVAHALVGDEVLLCHRGSQRAHRLKGPDADRWRALAAYGDYDAAAGWLVARHGGSGAQTHSELEAFVQKWAELDVFEFLTPCPHGMQPDPSRVHGGVSGKA